VFPVLLVSKKDGTKRFGVYYRALNAVTRLISFSLTTIKEIHDAESLPKFYGLRSGYWQTKLDAESSECTGFLTHQGNVVFNPTSFGLASLQPIIRVNDPCFMRSNKKTGRTGNGCLRQNW
jgi:hypothetical protein